MRSPRRSLGRQSERLLVSDRSIQDLRIRSIPTGTRGDGRDLRRFLYRGAAGSNVGRSVDRRIERGEFGPPLMGRLQIMASIHAHIEDAPTSPHTKIAKYRHTSAFIQWVDRRNDSVDLTALSAKSLFVEYAEHLKRRVRITKDLKQDSAHSMLAVLAQVLGPICDPDAPFANRALLDLASIDKKKRSKRTRGVQADKQRLDYTFQFGHFLADLCSALTAKALHGPLPIEVPFAGREKKLQLAPTQLNCNLDIASIPEKHSRKRALRVRADLPQDIDVKEARAPLVNLRISAEMLIFIAQTGMNLAQAKDLPRGSYRWQVDDENYLVRGVYKPRRQGIARFVVFRSYRDHFTRYLAWLDELKLSETDDRLFPVIYSDQVPPAYALPAFHNIRRHCRDLGISYVGSRDLRRTRINWLLRRSRDPGLTADMAAHTAETLLRVYEEGDLQSASQEIGAYHAQTDPSLSKSRTDPACLASNGGPSPLPCMPKEAPQPDCVTPEGCLWCSHLRDVLAPDYCWRLLSHRHLKTLEIGLFRPPASQPIHPAYFVVDRLNMKLEAIAARSAVCAGWVDSAKERIREGDYHPRWASLIEITESLL